MKYEYKVIVEGSSAQLERELNMHGAQGFRVVQAFTTASSDENNPVPFGMVIMERETRGSI